MDLVAPEGMYMFLHRSIRTRSWNIAQSGYNQGQRAKVEWDYQALKCIN
jgi:hypothetical protein